jgi:hypothetical protein
MSSEQNKNLASNIRAVWDALLEPHWDKDILIALGKMLYARRPLKEIDPALFNDLLPRLIEIVEVLETRFKLATPPTVVAESPDVVGTAGPGPCPTGPTGPVDPPGLHIPSVHCSLPPQPDDTQLTNMAPTKKA